MRLVNDPWGAAMTTTRFLGRPQGRLAYDDQGQGPLVVCLPGMGDLRAEYRFLVPQLLDAGFRVVTMDLRGHGESDAAFTDHERTTVGDDVVALLTELDAGPAHLIGASFGASAVAWAAAQVPARVASLTLIGPFVRDVPVPALQQLAFRLLLVRPWGLRAWTAWYAKLYPGSPPEDLAAYRQRLRRNLAEPGRFDAFRAMATTSAARVEGRLDEIDAPVLVVMGTADPDFPDPTAEARLIAERLDGEAVLAEGAGHYPHAEQPDVVGPAIVRFLAGQRPAAS